MSAYTIAICFGILAIPALAGMWFAWRARARRDAAVLAETPALVGPVIAQFEHTSYVSTTVAGAPLERIAVPGLRYKGYADVTVHSDGVSVAVTGEPTVAISAEQLRGTDTAGRRIGKAVERDGLSLLLWQPTTGAAVQSLESSFRFSEPRDQARFSEAVGQVIGSVRTTPTHDTTQEEA